MGVNQALLLPVLALWPGDGDGDGNGDGDGDVRCPQLDVRKR